jgi:hypothetical protein
MWVGQTFYFTWLDGQFAKLAKDSEGIIDHPRLPSYFAVLLIVRVCVTAVDVDHFANGDRNSATAFVAKFLSGDLWD